LNAKFGFGSASDSRVSDLAAGKLTPNLSDRIADVRGRQCPTRCGTSRCGAADTQDEKSTWVVRARWMHCLSIGAPTEMKLGVGSLMWRVAVS
jgi:hypothetical protein